MSRYSGPFDEHQLPHGAGTLFFPNSERVECTFSHGQPLSPMKLQYPSGSVYLGELLLIPNKPASRQGRGLCEEWNASSYIGGWAEDVRWGSGVAVSAGDAGKYEGDWVADSRDGFGVWIEKDSQYYGEWRHDVPHGYGKRLLLFSFLFISFSFPLS